ncbi:hypothetical protein DL93DRAFT_2155869 [Clavulina sp. PMI_390]|nr:hypothetical protein DL93DRAFT_2155869 [Clavulina sp. PMI_390]
MTITISVLPNELLLLIFEYTVLDPRDPAAMRLADLIALTSVNTLWRSLVISDPAFWTDVHVKMCHPRVSAANCPSSVLPGDFARIQGFLHRSKELPIHLNITRTWVLWKEMADEEAAERGWKAMYDLVMPHLKRCTSVTIRFTSVNASYHMEPPMLFESCEFPILKELNIDGEYPSSNLYSYEDGTWGKNWKVSPHHTPLQALTFNNPYQYLPRTLNVAWPSLLSLNLEVRHYWWPDICDTLALVHNLRRLSIHLLSSSNDPPVTPLASRQAKVEMPLLESIKTNNVMIWHDISTPGIASATITHFGPYRVLDSLASAQATTKIVLLRDGEDQNSLQAVELLRLLAMLPLREAIFDDDALATAGHNVFLLLGAFRDVNVVRFRQCHGLANVLRSLAEQREFRLGVGRGASVEQASGSQNIARILPKLEKVIIYKASNSKGYLLQIESATNRLRAASVEVEWLFNGRPHTPPKVIGVPLTSEYTIPDTSSFSGERIDSQVIANLGCVGMPVLARFSAHERMPVAQHWRTGMPPSLSALPNELLLLVSKFVIIAAGNAASARLANLFTLTSINAFWRNLVVEYRLFWTYIHVKLSDARTHQTKHPALVLPSDFARVHCFLHRSKESPIQLNITRAWVLWEDENEEKEAEQDWRSMYDLLRPHLRRCHSVSISFTAVDGRHPKKSPMFFESCDFPLLRELKIDGYYAHSNRVGYGQWGKGWKISPFHTPLQTLTFYGSGNYFPKALNVAWPSLLFLDINIHHSFWPKLCDTLALLPTLRSLSLHLLTYIKHPHISPCVSRKEKVGLPLLESIKTNNLMIFHNISTPILSSIRITDVGPYPVLDRLTTGQIGRLRMFLRLQDDHSSPQVMGLLQSLGALSVCEVAIDDDDLRYAQENILLILGALSHLEAVQFFQRRGLAKILNTIAQRREIALSIPQNDDPTSNAENNVQIPPKLARVIIDHTSATIAEEEATAIKDAANRLRAVLVNVQWMLDGRPIREP